MPADLAALSMASGSGEAWEQAYTAVHGRFLWAAQRMALFEEVFFMDAAGSVLISTNSGHEGQRLALNDYFVEGMKNSYIQQPSYSLSLGKMMIVASAPVRYGAKTIGVIAGVAGLTGLNQIMIERAGLGDTGETYLVGSNYRLLTYLRTPGYSIPDTYIRTDGTTGAIHSTAPGGSATYEGYAGEKVIGVYHWIPDLRVALIAEQEEAEALAASRQALWLIVAVAGLAAVLAILAGAMLTRRIVASLAKLGEHSRAHRRWGDSISKPKWSGEDEIGTLADAFNRMTGRLRGTGAKPGAPYRPPARHQRGGPADQLDPRPRRTAAVRRPIGAADLRLRTGARAPRHRGECGEPAGLQRDGRVRRSGHGRPGRGRLARRRRWWRSSKPKRPCWSAYDARRRLAGRRLLGDRRADPGQAGPGGGAGHHRPVPTTFSTSRTSSPPRRSPTSWPSPSRTRASTSTPTSWPPAGSASAWPATCTTP